MSAREFWIDDFISDKNTFCTAVSKTAQDDFIHVIEYSAYTAIKEDLRFYKNELDNRSTMLEHTKQDWLEARKELDELKTKHAEVLSYLPNVPNGPYEKELAQKLAEAREVLSNVKLTIELVNMHHTDAINGLIRGFVKATEDDLRGAQIISTKIYEKITAYLSKSEGRE